MSWSTRFGGCVVIKDWKTDSGIIRETYAPLDKAFGAIARDAPQAMEKNNRYRRDRTMPKAARHRRKSRTASPRAEAVEPKWREKNSKGKPVGSLYNAKARASRPRGSSAARPVSQQDC